MKDQLKFEIVDEKSMLELGKKFAQACDHGIIFLQGDLGAGKTTLVRGFLRSMGLQETVKSPTYTLVEPYQIKNKQIFHFDLFRLKDFRELTNIGIEEYFSDTAICLVEWPERGMPLLPPADIECQFKITATGREITCQALTDNGKKILQKLKK